LTAIGNDLRFGEGAGQVEMLVVGTDFERKKTTLAVYPEIGLGIRLPQRIVISVVVAAQVGRSQAQARALCASIEAGACLARVVRARAAIEESGAFITAGSLGDDVDRSCGGARAIQHCAAAAHNFDALDRIER